jgi:hypothetical protein
MKKKKKKAGDLSQAGNGWNCLILFWAPHAPALQAVAISMATPASRIPASMYSHDWRVSACVADNRLGSPVQSFFFAS